MAPMTCDECGKTGFTATTLNYQVIGYERLRTQGGTNALAARKQTGRKICDGCLTLEKNPLMRGQGGLI